MTVTLVSYTSIHFGYAYCMLEVNDDKISFVYNMKRARAHLGLGFKFWNSLADLWPCEASPFGGQFFG
jgi:hypothetical protein